MTSWHHLPAGPELRRIIAERLGWHMRKTWVGSGDVEYDYLIYNEDDMLVYQREITSDDMVDEAQAEHQTWLAAVSDEDSPRWDEDLNDCLELVYGLEYDVQPQDDEFVAWVTSADHSGRASSDALALARAWLQATDGQDDFLS